jgi:hypothetical protein
VIQITFKDTQKKNKKNSQLITDQLPDLTPIISGGVMVYHRYTVQ